jgi:chromosome partitioning protein
MVVNMPLIVTGACNKGGVGKTTTVVNLAHGMALRGKRVLLLDVDINGFATDALGAENGPGLYDVLTGRATVAQAAIEVRENLWLVPGGLETEAAQDGLIRREVSERRVAEQLMAFGAGFDVLVIDTPPTGLLQKASVLAANVVVAPLTVDYYGPKGFAYLLDYREQLGGRGRLIMLPTMYDQRTPRNRAAYQTFIDFAEANGISIFAPIPFRDEIRHLPYEAHTIWEHDAKGYGKAVLVELQGLFNGLIDELEQEGSYVTA